MRRKTIGLALAMAWAGQGCTIQGSAHGSVSTTVGTSATVFGTTSAYAGSVEGTVYYLDAGTQRLPTNWSSLQPQARVYTDRWDVGPRRFTEGFPGASRRAEWFAIRYQGQFFVPTAGVHSFRLNASAGARLLIDGRVVVDNDGLHAVRSAVGSIPLSAGSHSIEVQYFQGPAADIALQLFVTPPSGREQLFIVQAPQGQVVTQPPPPPPVVSAPPPPPPPPVVVAPPPPPARPPRPGRQPPPPPAPPQPVGPVVTPFGSTAPFAGAFQGHIYHVDSGNRRWPTDWSRLQSRGSVYADRWDIAQRPFDEGFPGITDRSDWFAIRYAGRIDIQVPGTYSFRVGSRGGARLVVDGRVVVENDGPRDFRSATGSVALAAGPHDVEIQFLQRQRGSVGLQVFVTPPNSPEQLFVTQPGGLVVVTPPPPPVVVTPPPAPPPGPRPPVVVTPPPAPPPGPRPPVVVTPPPAPPPGPRPPVVVTPPPAPPPGPRPPVVVTPPPAPPPGQPPVVVPPASTPFGSTTTFSGALQGNIYYLPSDTQRLPTRWDTLQPQGTIYADRWDIAQRQFSEGFPGVTDRFEWFAIRYTGQVVIAAPGTYSFRIESDDGAKLFIDGQVVVDNDGVHPLRSANGTVTLAAGVHTIELQYFQGPRYEIALRVFVTPPGATERIFVTQPAEVSGGRGPWEGRGPRTDDREGGRGPRQGRGRR